MDHQPESADLVVTTQYDVMGQTYLDVGQEYWFSSPPDLWTRRKIAEFIPSFAGKVVLDGGCGSGIDMEAYLTKGAAKVMGFDPSTLMLSAAAEHFELSTTHIADGLVEVQQGTYEAIPYPDASADIVIGIYSLHYCVNLDAAYAELYRVLKPGGRIVFACTHPADLTAQKVSAHKGQEILPCRIYNRSVTVMKPTHTLTDYFSPFFLKHFTLEHMEEWYPEDPQAPGKEMKQPKLFAFGAIKK